MTDKCEKREFKVDPAMFISPPFVQCPKCGKAGAFGVLSIYPHHYVRRCAQCRFDQSSALPELKKTILYLDQFALSNMMKALNPETKAYKKGTLDAFWHDLFCAADKLTKLQLLICIDSEFHENESLVSPYPQALKRMSDQLSGGSTFHDYDYIARLQIHTHIQNWVAGKGLEAVNCDATDIVEGELHGWTDRLIVTVSSKDATIWSEQLKKLRAATHEQFSTTFEAWQKEKHPFDDWFGNETRAYGKSVIRGYLSILKKWDQIAKGQSTPTLEDIYPTPAVLTMQLAQDGLRKAGVGDADLLNKSVEYFLSDALENLPFNRIAASLCAALAVRANGGRKQLPTRGMVNDLRMISAFLPYCDAMLVDDECRSLLNEKSVQAKLNMKCQVYSTETKGELLHFMQGLEKNCPRDHLAKVREVYGDKWGEPYESMFRPSEK
jgi:hypothetical protein